MKEEQKQPGATEGSGGTEGRAEAEGATGAIGRQEKEREEGAGGREETGG